MRDTCKADSDIRIRCDRLQPCSNCSSRGIGTSCTYSNPQATQSSHGSTHVQSRIGQLENLVLSFMQQTTASDLPPADLRQAPPNQTPCLDCLTDIKIRESGASYVSTAHWTAILDSIAELRDHLEENEEQTTLTSNTVQPHADFPRPQLPYNDCATRVTPALILVSIPPRPVVDCLVSRYFNVRDMDLGKAPNGMQFPILSCSLTDCTPGIPHSSKFHREVPPICNS